MRTSQQASWGVVSPKLLIPLAMGVLFGMLDAAENAEPVVPRISLPMAREGSTGLGEPRVAFVLLELCSATAACGAQICLPKIVLALLMQPCLPWLELACRTELRLHVQALQATIIVCSFVLGMALVGARGEEEEENEGRPSSMAPAS